MSWDVFIQQLPDGVRRVGDIPADFVPGPLGSRSEIVAGIRDVFPNVDFSDPEWGRVEEDQFSIDINIKADDPVKSFALHVRGAAGAGHAVGVLLDRLGFRALDPQSPTGFFEAPASGQRIARPNWDQLEQIREILLGALSDWGVRRVEFVTAFSEPYDSSVWLGTSTDSERDELLDVPDLLGLIHDAIQLSGLDGSLVTGATAQSQETVDRDYAGSWFYALR